MKIFSIIILACLGVLSFQSTHAQETNKITASIKFVNVPLDNVLEVYKEYTRLDLVIATDVPSWGHINLVATNTPADNAAHLIEQALLKQAGIVITHLNDKQASVTYNDKLPLKN